MRVILIFMLLVFMNPTIAINKCEINGKVSYQTAACPKNANSKYLMKDKYVSEQQLLKYQKEHDKLSEESLNSLKKSYSPNMPPVASKESPDNNQQAKPQQIEKSNDESQLQLEAVHEQDKNIDKHVAPHVNVPGAFNYVNPKLENMDRKLEQHNKELQQRLDTE